MSSLRELAEAFGVSKMTVSRALNGSPGVSDELRRRILAKAEEIGYINPRLHVPKEIGARTVGVCLFNISSSFADDALRAIDEAAEKRGLRVLFTHARLSPARERAILTSFKESGLLGIIAVPVYSTENIAFYKELKASGTPIVFLGRHLPDTGIHGIVSDNMQGGFSVGHHLVERGHKSIGVITGPDTKDGTGPVEIEDRLLGLNRALLSAGLMPARILTTDSPQSRDEDVGYLTVKEHFGRYAGRSGPSQRAPANDLPTALFAINDSVAVGAIAALRELGIDVPGGVAVAGFDDSPVARYVTPPLTTVHQDWRLMAQLAIDHLVSPKKANGPAMTTLVPSRLIKRASTGG